MYYFKSRSEAGDLLADQLEAKYRYENCAVLALGDGAVMVGAQIATRLHCVINLLLTEPIQLPKEEKVLATIDNFGGVSYGDTYSSGELEEITGEYFNFIEQQKLEKKFEMNRKLGLGGALSRNQLRNRNIIIVSDGLINGSSMRAAADFLKPLKTKRLVMVTPFAGIDAVDQMHILADDLLCLNVIENIISVNHYYDDNDMPPHEEIISVIEDIVLHWV